MAAAKLEALRVALGAAAKSCKAQGQALPRSSVFELDGWTWYGADAISYHVLYA